MKKFIALLLAMCCVFTCVACGDDPAPAPHEHNYSESWSKDANSHWHACTCGDKQDSAAHSFVAQGEVEVCSVCGYEKGSTAVDPAPDTPGEPIGTWNKPGSNKTQINFLSFNGGIGSVWLEKAAEEFAKAKANTSYATGKKGVYINISKTLGVNLDTFSSSGQHIAITERFYTPQSLSATGQLYDLTELVQDDSREGGALEDVIYESAKGGLMSDGKYYGLPHYESYGGLSYNRDRFNELGLFFTEDGEAYESDFSNNTYYFGDETYELTAGPDGDINTEEDNGLPATMEQLIVLMDYISSVKNVAPMTLSGLYKNYSTYFTAGLWAALAGTEQMQVYYNGDSNLNGKEVKIEVVKREGSGGIEYTNDNLFEGVSYIQKPKTEWITLDGTNGYRANDMVAKYYAYAMFQIMQREKWFSTAVTKPNLNHFSAQEQLLCGADATYEAPMLIEASYWYNEAEEAGTFTKVKKVTGKNQDEIDVRIMSLPSSVYDKDAVARPTSYIDISQCYLYVNKKIADTVEMETAVKEFVAFLYTEPQLQAFTVETGMPRAIEYDLTEAQKEAMGNFYRRMWETRKTDGSNVIYCSGTTASYVNNRPMLQIHLSGEPFFGGNFEADTYSHVLSAGAAAAFEQCSQKKTEWRNVAPAA